MKIEEKILLEENELKPNRYSADAVFWAMVGTAVSTILNELGIFHVDPNKMRGCLILVILCSAIVQLIARNPGISGRKQTKYVVLTMIFLETLTATVVISQWTELLIAFPIMLAVQYHDPKMTIWAIVGANVVALLSGPLSILIGFPDPTFYTYEICSIGYQLPELVPDPGYHAWSYVPGILLYVSLPRCLTIAALGPVAISITRQMSINVRSRADAAYYSSIDIMTGLLNRFSFEARAADFTQNRPLRLGCVYADADELHVLNNTQGHAAGDQLLKACAEELSRTFGEQTYRIGGDEFLAFVLDKTPEEIQTGAAEIRRRLKEQGYHMSIGFSCLKENQSINDLVREAENEMYAAKRKYYVDSGKDRRKNR